MNSETKQLLIMYLGLRGGQTGRALAKALKKSPTQVFKALTQLIEQRVLKRCKIGYVLNRNYPYYAELISIIGKSADNLKKNLPFYPKLKKNRCIDAVATYEMFGLRPAQNVKYQKLSDVLRKKYA